MAHRHPSHDKCADFGGASKRGKPCGRPAGWGTKHPGTGRCKLHFGNTDAENRKAQTVQAEQACETLGIPHDGITPEQALLAELWECLGNVDFYRRQVQRLATSIGEAKPHVLVVLYERERDRLRQIASELIRCGVEERRVSLAEADAARVFAAINAAFTAMGLEERMEEFRAHFADALSHGHRSLPRRATG